MSDRRQETGDRTELHRILVTLGEAEYNRHLFQVDTSQSRASHETLPPSSAFSELLHRLSRRAPVSPRSPHTALSRRALLTLLCLTLRRSPHTAVSHSASLSSHCCVSLCAALLTLLCLTLRRSPHTAVSRSAPLSSHCCVSLCAVLLTLLCLTLRRSPHTAVSHSVPELRERRCHRCQPVDS